MSSLWSSSDSELSDTEKREKLKPTLFDDPLQSGRSKESKKSQLLHDLLGDSVGISRVASSSSTAAPASARRDDVHYYDLYVEERDKRMQLEAIVVKLNYRISELEELLDANSSKAHTSLPVQDMERDKRQMERQRRHMANAKRSSRRTSTVKTEKQPQNKSDNSKSPTMDSTPAVAETTIPQFEPIPPKPRANLWDSDSSDWSSDDSVVDTTNASQAPPPAVPSEATIENHGTPHQHHHSHSSHADRAVMEQRVNDAVLLWAKGKDILAMIKSLYVIYEGPLPNIDYTIEYSSPNVASEIRRMYLNIARCCHPDKQPSNCSVKQRILADKLFSAITDAYQHYKNNS